jgi:hypothetical protein
MRRAWHSRGRRIRRRLCSHPWILFWKREVYRFHMLPARWLYRAPSIRSPAEILFAPRTIPGRTGNVNRSSDERSKYVTAGASSLILSRFASVLPNSIRIARSRRYGVTLKPSRHQQMLPNRPQSRTWSLPTRRNRSCGFFGVAHKLVSCPINNVAFVAIKMGAGPAAAHRRQSKRTCDKSR